MADEGIIEELNGKMESIHNTESEESMRLRAGNESLQRSIEEIQEQLSSAEEERQNAVETLQAQSQEDTMEPILAENERLKQYMEQRVHLMRDWRR